MTDFLYNVNTAQTPLPPESSPTGWPNRTGRALFGAQMKDERPLTNPSNEIGASQLEIMFWQLGGIGICAPLAVFAFDPTNSGGNVRPLRFGAFVWDQVVYYNTQLANYPSYLALTVNGSGDYTFTFPATIAGRDGTLQPITIRGATVAPMALASFPAPNRRAEVSITGQALRVLTRDSPGSGGALVDTPVVVVVF